MKIFTTLAAVAVAALSMIATPALAEDSAVHDAFTGPRADLHIGSDTANLKGSSGKAFTYGVEVGYDLPVTDYITAGVFGGVDLTGSDFNLSDTSKVNVNRDLSVGGRIGVKASERFMVYGGVAYTNLGTRTVDTLLSRSHVSDLGGYRLAGGAELKVVKGVALKAEYRWSDYGSGDTRSAVLVGSSVHF